MSTSSYFPRLLSLFLLVGSILLSSCHKKVEYLGDIKKLSNKTAKQLEKILGRATSKNKVTDPRCEKEECEKRQYKNGEFEVLFKNKKSIKITLYGVPDYTDNDEAIESLGLTS